MKLDPEAMLTEAQTLIASLTQRVLFLAGRVGALEKEVNEKKAAPPVPPPD